MVEWKTISRRKKTGGINNSRNAKTKSLSDRGGLFSKTSVSKEEKKHKKKVRGNSYKNKITHANTVIVNNKDIAKKAKIIDVIENKADKHFVREKVITKGAILDVELDGKKTKVKVTSRPGQDGIINAVLVNE